MSYEIQLHDKLDRDFKTIPSAMQDKIVTAIESLTENPRPVGVKKLSGIKRGTDNVYRIRVGNYRIGYQIFDRELFIFALAAGERGSIYQTLKRRLR